ncbi:MAG: MFS transporter [Rhodoluna sp.]
MPKTKSTALVLIAIVIVAAVLRSPVASLGPLIPEITQNLNLSPIAVSILASGPVLCFGVGAFASPWLVSRMGVNHALFAVLCLLAIGLSVRMFLGYAGLLIGTIAAGLSIAIANVLLPTVVRKNFPNRVSLVTGIYTTMLSISASVASGIAVVTSQLFGGWSPALAIWILPTLLAILLWTPQIRNQEPHVAQPANAASEERRAVNRSSIAWAIVAFFGLQSLSFYALLGWLPSSLIAIGFTPVEAGVWLGFSSGVGIPVGLIASTLFSNSKSLSWWAAGASLLTFSGYALLTFSMATNAKQLIFLATILVGFGMSTTFPISLSLISSRASTHAQTTQLSAMSQGWGYLVAAAGSFAFGLIASVTGSWLVSFAMVTILLAAQIGFGYYAGKPRVIPAK